MQKRNFDITLNGYLPSLLRGLDSEGINTDRYLKHSYLKKLDLYNPDHYIPNVLLGNMLVEIKQDLGINSLSNDLRQHFTSTKMGRISTHIFQSPNFLTLLQEVVKHQKYVRTNYTTSLEIFGPISKFTVKINEEESEGKLICEEIDILRILDVFTLVGGSNFAPIELGITGHDSYGIESILPKGNYSLKLNQSESWILFKTNLLSKQIPSIIEKPTAIEPISNSVSTTFCIEKLISSFKLGTIPQQDEIAQMLDISRRTIERNLKLEGTSYKKLKQKYILQESINLLENTTLSVREISQNLDYLHSQNFIRSFKSWTGMTPNQYRSMMK